MRATIPAMAGRPIAAIRRPSISAALEALGLTPLHRRSFAPVREIIARFAQPELQLENARRRVL